MCRLAILILLLNIQYSLSQTLLNFEENGQWGLMNEHGDTLLKPQFDYVYGWNTVAMYRNGEVGSKDFEAGLITSDLRIVPLSNRLQLDCAYGPNDPVKRVYFSFWGKKGKGVADSTGKIIVPPIFDRLEKFDREDQALCRLGKKWGVIDINGNYIIEPKFRKKENAKLMQNHHKIGLDKKVYTYIKWDQRRDGLVPVYKGMKPTNQYEETLNKWGFVNLKGEPVSDFIYSEGSRFTNGVGYMKIGDSSFIVRHRDFKPHDLEKENVTLILDPLKITTDTNQFTGEPINVIHNAWRDVVRGIGEYQFVDTSSRRSRYRYYVIYKHKEFYQDHYYYGAYDLAWCNAFIPAKYDSISMTPDSLFLVKTNNKYGITRGGRYYSVNPDYDSIRYIRKGTYELFKSERPIKVYLNGSRLYYNSMLEESGDTSLHYFDPNVEDYKIVGHNQYYIFKPSFKKSNERIKHLYQQNPHVLKVELQFGDWGYINIDTGKIIYWNGNLETREVVALWAVHLPLLFSL